MALSCILTPRVRDRRGDLVESRLFNDLMDRAGDREFAKGVWALAQLDSVRKLKGVEFDENGEPTIKSLDRALKIDGMLRDGVNLRQTLRDLGGLEKGGRAKVFRTYREASQRVIDFNSKSRRVVVDLVPVADGYVMSAERVGLNNSTRASELVFGVTCLDQMRDMLHAIGLDVAVMDDPHFKGVFSPQGAETTAEGLKTVIRIARGQEGMEAFPEEFAHVMVAGLRGQPVVQRLLSALSTEEAQRRVLGAQYDTYRTLYKGDVDLMAQEAAGRMLADRLTGRGEVSVEQGERNLLQRVWDFFRSLFSRADPDDVDTMIYTAAEAAAQLAGGIADRSLLPLVDMGDVMNAGEMYSIRAEAGAIADTANRALETLRTKMRDLRNNNKENAKTAKRMRELMDRHEYVNGCSKFLYDTVCEMERMERDLIAVKEHRTYGNNSDIEHQLRNAKLIRDVEKMIVGYGPVLTEMRNIRQICEESGIAMTKTEISKFEQLSEKADRLMRSFEENSRGLKFDLCYEYLSHFWKGDVTIDIGPNKGKTMTLEMIMTMAAKDISLMDALWSSMSSCGDAFLSLIDQAFNTHLYDRDAKNRAALQRVRAIEAEREKAGFKSDFMYERDAKGKLTGRIISPVDYGKFQRARDDYMDSLSKKGLDDLTIQSEMDRWDHDNTEWVETVAGHWELMPLFESYGRAGCRGHLDFDGLGLDGARLKYYKDMMAVKADHDAMLPTGKSTLFLAPQVMKSSDEILFENAGSPREYVRQRMSRLKRDFVRHSNDTSLGNKQSGKKGVREPLGLDGKPLKNVPIFYTRELEDMDLLSTDMGGAMLSYASMANNFAEMRKICDMFELMRDVVESRELDMTKGTDLLGDAYSLLGDIFSKRTPESSKTSYIMKVLNNYLDKGLYGIGRAEEMIGSFDFARTADKARDVAGNIALGLNPFSAAANWMIGKTQFLIEAAGKEFFNVKDAAWAQKEFTKQLAGMIADAGSANPKNKLLLMNELFDSEMTFAQMMRNSPFYNGKMQRIFGKGSLRMLISAGYTDLYSCNTLAVLHNTKVKVNGAVTNLWDAYEVHTGPGGATELRLKEGTTDMDGNALVRGGLMTEAGEAFYKNVRARVRKSGSMTQGTYNQQDYGLIHKCALGRMVMQFRQWLPEHVNRRWGRAYYDAATGEYREGFHMTLIRMTGNFVKELLKGNFHAAIAAYNCSPKERANIRKSLTEIGMFIALSIVSALVFKGLGDDDKKKKAKLKSKRGLAWRTGELLLDRELLAVGEFIPWYTMAKNFKSMWQQPMAGTTGIGTLLNAACVWHLFERVDSGYYKGWNRWLADLAKCVPGENNIIRTYRFVKPNGK